MNYQQHYDRLIERARNRTLDGYKESHHITPRCMHGSDDKDNLVNLTAREHFIAHLLLMKIYPKSYGLIRAVNMMCSHQTENRSKNRMYGWLKEKLSKEMSRKQRGEGNSQYGKMWIYSLEEKKCVRILKCEQIPDGWLKGRVIDFELLLKKKIEKENRKTEKEKILSENRKIKEEERKKRNKEKTLERKIERDKILSLKKDKIIKLYYDFIKSDYRSINKFIEGENIEYSTMILSMYWKKYIDEYKVNSKEGTPYRSIYNKLKG